MTPQKPPQDAYEENRVVSQTDIIGPQPPTPEANPDRTNYKSQRTYSSTDSEVADAYRAQVDKDLREAQRRQDSQSPQ